MSAFATQGGHNESPTDYQSQWNTEINAWLPVSMKHRDQCLITGLSETQRSMPNYQSQWNTDYQSQWNTQINAYLPVSIACASLTFHCSATSLASGSSGFGALSRAWMDSRTVRICNAGLHFSVIQAVNEYAYNRWQLTHQPFKRK